MRNFSAMVVVALAALLSSPASRGASQDSWIVGFWHAAHDDKGVQIEFRADGSYIGYDSACKKLAPWTYFVHTGDIYVVHTIYGKGPVALIFHPNSTHTQLTLTSSSTESNTDFERKSGSHCGANG